MPAKLPSLAAIAIAALLPAAPGSGRGQPPAVSRWVAEFNSEYEIVPDVVYRTVGGRALTVDLYLRSDGRPHPTVYFIHGGAWLHGTKSWELGYMLPWLQLGWSLVSVDYRLSTQAPAPAAVEDCFCALHWIGENAGKYHFDLRRLVVTGASAGGNLALLVGMAPPAAGFERGCPGPRPPLAAIVNIAGIADVVESLSGRSRDFTEKWLGGGGEALARRVSPLSYVRPGLPPVLTIHGDADPTVPYDGAVRLRDALTRAGVPNELLTIPRGKHGGWRPQDYDRIYRTLPAFLARFGLTDAAANR